MAYKSYSTTVDVDVDVSLDDFETRELIEEIKNRKLKPKERDNLKEILVIDDCQLIQVKTLDDKLKLEIFKDAMQRFSLAEIENRLNQ